MFYFIDEGVLWDIIAGVTKPSYLLGWLALALFILLGAISNNISVKALGEKWKSFGTTAGCSSLAKPISWDAHRMWMYRLFTLPIV